MNIYIVFGDTGEYSDYRQWIVCAYQDEEKAKARVVELETLMKNLGAVTGSDWDKLWKAGKAMREHERGDVNFDIDYTGTHYCYEATELKDA